jgi:hypothetical protein
MYIFCKSLCFYHFKINKTSPFQILNAYSIYTSYCFSFSFSVFTRSWYQVISHSAKSFLYSVEISDESDLVIAHKFNY